MLTRYVLRGMKAGAVAGIAFGLFVAFVGNPLISYVETFEEGGHGGAPVISSAVTALVSVVGGVLLGILLGAVFLGAVFYFLEPAIPGEGGTKSYLLAAAGFVTVSGSPWLVLPPQPPGVEQSLPVETRIPLYLAMMIAGAMACGVSGYVFNRLRSRSGRLLAAVGAIVPIGILLIVATVAPTNSVSGPIPGELAAVFRTIMAAGQVGLWIVLASVHTWLLGRERETTATDCDPITPGDPAETIASH